MAPLGDEGVVDPVLKVYGLDNVRVADASIFPKIVAGHTVRVFFFLDIITAHPFMDFAGSTCHRHCRESFRPHKSIPGEGSMIILLMESGFTHEFERQIRVERPKGPRQRLSLMCLCKYILQPKHKNTMG